MTELHKFPFNYAATSTLKCTCAKVRTFSANFLASYTPGKRNDNIFRPLVPVKNLFIPDQQNN